MFPKEIDSLPQPVITSTDSDVMHVISEPISGYRESAERRFPILSRTHTFNFFPFSVPQYKETTSTAIIQNECEYIRRNRHELVHFTKLLMDLCIHDKIEQMKKLEHHIDAFPFTKLTTNVKTVFPIRYEEGKEECRIPLDPGMQMPAKNESVCKSKDFRFPLICTKDSTKFPLNQSEVNTIIQFNIQPTFWLLNPPTSSPKPKLDILEYSDIEASPVHFPLTKITIKRQTSKEKYNDEFVFPIKPEIFSNILSSTIRKCYNNSTDNNASSSTMTPSQNESMCGGILVDTYNDIKTNLERCEHEQPEQKQDHSINTFLHNDNDDMLAIGESKNIYDSGQPKNCEELRHIAETQNSSSATETAHSHKNMNDIQKPQQEQQIKEIQPTTKTSSEFKSLGNEMQRDDQAVYFASNTSVHIPTRNNLSDIYFENKQEPWSTYLAHSEVCDPSSQEVLIVDRRVACEKRFDRIKAAAVPPPTYKSSYVNESASLTSLTPTPSITLTYAEAPHVQNDYECSVNSGFNADDFSVYNISTEIDGKVGDKTTSSRLSAESSVFIKGADNAMTLTKFAEANEEDINSVSSSQLDDNQCSVFDAGSQIGMKIDMNSSKLAPDVKTGSVGNNIRGKSEPRQIMPVSGSNVLAAATDLSKLANFGKTRRESSLLSQSGSVASIDEKDSVLPSRTLLRRQRRLQAQGSEDKQEDPIERLNRLRARISGALTEVKGVLQHYSVDEAAETNKTPVLKNSVDLVDRIGPTYPKATTAQGAFKEDGPVNFRFIKKVRRRSLFTDDDVKVTKELTAENAEDKPTAMDEEKKGNITTDKDLDDLRELTNNSTTKPTEIGLAIPQGQVTNNAETTEKGADVLKDLSKDHNTKTEKGKADAQSVISIPDISLGTLNEKNNSNDSHQDSNLEVRDPQKNENMSKETDKKQIEPQTLKTKKTNRRASIALVEGSQIDPPVNTSIPHKIKTQRRPSDSEALIKQKTKFTEADSNASIKKVKTIVKVKRPSVKSNADVTTKNKTASSTEINQSDNNIKDDSTSALEVSNAITSADAVTETAATITAMVPKTSETLSTQLATTIAINDASSLSCAEKQNDECSEVKQPLSIAANNSRTPTKLHDQNGAMVALLVSPLRTGESSSHTIKPETQPLSLLASNSNLDTSIVIATKDLHTNEENLNVSNQKEINESEQSAILKTQPTKPADCITQKNLDSKPLEKFNDSNKDSAEFSILPGVPDSNIIETVQTTSVLSGTPNNFYQKESSDKLSSHSAEVYQANGKMPEQQVAPTPVKPVQLFAENDKGKTKKIIIKKIVRKNSVDKAIEKKKPINDNLITFADKSEKDETHTSEPPSNAVIAKPESTEEESRVCNEVATSEDLEVPVESTKPKKPRKVKKKVIIKRQQRKLSVGENTFFKETEQPDASPTDTETLERAIAYVTDEEDEASEPDTSTEPIKPIKSCIKQREFQVGDWVMYGERYRKTQIRWRKGQITERITSISYKINIDGTEVSAHISYIKKYTDRKVNFGGKEYLEIDYEQIAEEERRARTYSIWNMV